MDQDGPPHTTSDSLSGNATLLILSHVRFIRETLCDVITRDGSAKVLGQCSELAEATFLSKTLSPNVLLLDAHFPDGLGAVRRVQVAAPEIRVVVFAMSETEESVITWAQAGIAGYVPSTTALSDISATLALIVDGAQACEARVAAGLLRRIAQSGRAQPEATRLATPLTAREREIATMIGAGLSNKEIARRLNIGVGTTKSHVHNLLGKLNVQRRAQAARLIREQRP